MVGEFENGTGLEVLLTVLALRRRRLKVTGTQACAPKLEEKQSRRRTLVWACSGSVMSI